MEIKEGDKFYCFKEVVMSGGENDRKLCYVKGKAYTSECDGAITDEFGDKYHAWPSEGKTLDHFAIIGNYKWDIEGFPELVVEWMLKEQELQGNKRDVSVFEKCKFIGFNWGNSRNFRRDQCQGIIQHKNFQVFFDIYPYGVDKAHNNTLPKVEEPECIEALQDPINHPPHYGGEENPYEAIKVIEAWGANFNIGNALKYISRAGKKGEIKEDLQKAVWYLNREISKI